MPEKQNVEYKQNWHNDYLKWIVIHLLNEASDILNKKFFVKLVDFEGLQRIEKVNIL